MAFKVCIKPRLKCGKCLKALPPERLEDGCIGRKCPNYHRFKIDVDNRCEKCAEKEDIKERKRRAKHPNSLGTLRLVWGNGFSTGKPVRRLRQPEDRRYGGKDGVKADEGGGTGNDYPAGGNKSGYPPHQPQDHQHNGLGAGGQQGLNNTTPENPGYPDYRNPQQPPNGAPQPEVDHPENPPYGPNVQPAAPGAAPAIVPQAHHDPNAAIPASPLSQNRYGAEQPNYDGHPTTHRDATHECPPESGCRECFNRRTRRSKRYAEKPYQHHDPTSQSRHHLPDPYRYNEASNEHPMGSQQPRNPSASYPIHHPQPYAASPVSTWLPHVEQPRSSPERSRSSRHRYRHGDEGREQTHRRHNDNSPSSGRTYGSNRSSGYDSDRTFNSRSRSSQSEYTDRSYHRPRHSDEEIRRARIAEVKQNELRRRDYLLRIAKDIERREKRLKEADKERQRRERANERLEEMGSNERRSLRKNRLDEWRKKKQRKKRRDWLESEKKKDDERLEEFKILMREDERRDRFRRFTRSDMEAREAVRRDQILEMRRENERRDRHRRSCG